MIKINILVALFQSLWLFLLLISVVDSNQIETIAKFTNNYFHEKGVRQFVTFGCWNNDERVRFLLKMDMRICYVSISKKLDMTKILKVNYYKLGVLLDLDCPNSEIIFQQYTLPYNESYFWLIITKDEGIPLKSLRELPLSINTEMTLALYNSDNCILYDVYNPSYRHGGKLNVTYMGYWKNQEGIKIDLNQYKYIRRGNLCGLSLNFSVVLNNKPRPDFYTYLTTPIDRHLDTMHRFSYNLILQLRDFYNFTMHLTQASTWGYLKNGSFDGILGDMIEGTVDISISPFMFKVERYDVVEHTVQHYVGRATIIFRHPKSNGIRNPFFMPFSHKVWRMIIISEILYISVVYVSTKCEKYYHKKLKNETTHPVVESVMIVVAAMSQQGFGQGPRFYSGRIVFLSLFVWALLVNQFYSASIVGSLLSEPTRFINSLESLTESNVEFGIEDMAYNHDFIATTTDPEARQLYNKKVAPNKKRKKANYMPAEEGLQKLQKGGFSFHVDVDTAYKIIDETFTEDEICDLSEIQLFPVKHLATVIAKHSPFKKMVTYGLRKIIEHGAVERLVHIWKHKRPTCPKSHSSKPVPVPLAEFIPLLFFLFMGFTTALFMMFFENIFRKYKFDYQILSVKILKISRRY